MTKLHLFVNHYQHGTNRNWRIKYLSLHVLYICLKKLICAISSCTVLCGKTADLLLIGVLSECIRPEPWTGRCLLLALLSTSSSSTPSLRFTSRRRWCMAWHPAPPAWRRLRADSCSLWLMVWGRTSCLSWTNMARPGLHTSGKYRCQCEKPCFILICYKIT